MSYIESHNILTSTILDNAHIDYTVKKGNFYPKQNNNTSNNSDSSTINSDTIDISENNPNVINTKKAYDAFRETCSENQKTGTLEDLNLNLEVSFFNIMYEMKNNGISVPSFTASSENPSGFLSFIDNMKNFIQEKQKENSSNPNDFFSNYSNDLLNFCDLYKEKLAQYGCK